MSTTAIVLITLSVVLHVGWNWVAKGRPTAGFFLTGNLIGALAFTPVLLLIPSRLVDLPIAFWMILACTGLVQGLYCLALAAAYRTGELSIVYPLVRSLAPALVVLASFALGRGASVSAACVAGVAAILLGSGLLGYGNWRANPGQPVHGAALAFSLLAAFAVATYTLIDDTGVKLLVSSQALFGQAAPDPAQPTSWLEPRMRTGMVFVALQGWAVSAALALWVGTSRARRAAWVRSWSRAELGDATVMGIGGLAAYGLVLASMAYVEDVSYVAGFRQLSVPLGAAAGILWLAESRDGWKLTGLITMLAGLLMIALNPGS